ncbi:receptor-like protein 6 [Carex rostrata]
MALVALVSLSLVLLSSIKTTISLTHAHCLPEQRHALLQLKQGFKTNELHSWNSSTNCCTWVGITCDEQTGMVTEVNLAHKLISGELNPALFNLSSLQYLNLGGNLFNNLILPQIGFERLDNLTHLDLSNSGFAGQVPIGFSALTNLITLDLSDIGNPNPLYLHDTGLKTLLSNLTKLQVLHLDGVDISLNGSDWGNSVLQVGPTLQQLSMEDCGLRGNIWDEIFDLTNLTELDLSQNAMLSGQIPDSIGKQQYLSTLDLYNCSLHGEVPPSITNITSLEMLVLGSNILTGTIPISLFSHPSLELMDLSYNQLSGYLPDFSNGSSILEFIILCYNNLEGQLPISIFKFPQLFQLTVASNNFNSILNLDLIEQNKNLDSLDLSNNKLSIIEGKNHNQSFYASFPQLKDIWLASCNLTKFPSFLSYQTSIDNLDLSNNNIDGVIPNWLCSKTSITYLNLSHNFFTKIEGDAHLTSLEMLDVLDIHSNNISGPVPLLPQGMYYVDFSSNYFFSLPAYFVSTLIYLFLSTNRLTGEIPLSICNATRLQVLELSDNNLTGTIPPCILENAQLLVLSMKSNKLSGPLPRNISEGCKLRTIDLSGNKINGSLPQTLTNCNTLEVLDLGNNQIVNRFPFWLGNLKNLRVLVLSSNQFYGTISNMKAKTKTNNSFFPSLMVFDISSNRFRGIIPRIVFESLSTMVNDSDSRTFMFGGPYDYQHYYQNSITVISKGQEMEIKNSLSIFSSLDLSQNGFSGGIPEEIGELKSLDVLNLSHNVLTGPIPSEFANLKKLESLDLSSNQLFGPIPQELTALTFLASLNFSYNNLVGEIPQAHQFLTFSNASYLGNPRLCGSPLSVKCAADHSSQGFNKSLPSKSSTDIIGLSVSIGLGLGVGFASIFWALVSWENGRKWFNFILDRFYFRHLY